MRKIKTHYIKNDEKIGGIFSHGQCESDIRKELFLDEFNDYGFTLYSDYSIPFMRDRQNVLNARELYINIDLLSEEKIKRNSLMSEEDLHYLMFNLIDGLHKNNDYEIDNRILKAILILSHNLKKK